jgi:hypothetical protein
MEMTGSEQAEPTQGTAFLTLSLLIDSEQMNTLLAACWPRARWNQELLKKVRKDYEQSYALNDAIDPMFEDIADRSRNLFLDDFLLDTPNTSAAEDDGKKSSNKAAHARRGNVCARFDLVLDHAIEWQTEGRNVETFEFGPGPIRFDGVLCRAFWMAHSNEALSYHLSFEVPYGAGVPQYFGLSLLQKVFFNTEGTEWLLDNGGTDGWLALRDGALPTPLLGLVEGLFERHLLHLLSELGGSLKRPEPIPASIQVGLWQRLVLRQPRLDVTPVKAWEDSARHRRLLVVLSDPTFFKTLERARAANDPLLDKHEPFEPTEGALDTYQLDAVRDELKRRVTALPVPEGQNAPDDEAVRAEVDRYATSLFLSGFLQNIVDFLQQDDLELHDGLSPIYPAADASGANEGFMLYATPSVMYEVVSRSRSLKSGQPWIGTCPYIFLVHMTAFHNESLVLRYENNVSGLVEHLQAQGLRSDADAASDQFEPVLKHAFECIRDFRLVTFEQVHKHYSFNVFRYETEQTFFREIEKVRGVVQRREYWDKVLEHLTETVDGLKEDREARFERNVAVLGAVLAVTGVIQTWIAIFPLKDGLAWRNLTADAHWLALGALLGLLAWLGWRFALTRQRSTKAAHWRTHGQSTASPFTPSR